MHLRHDSVVHNTDVNLHPLLNSYLIFLKFRCMEAIPVTKRFALNLQNSNAFISILAHALSCTSCCCVFTGVLEASDYGLFYLFSLEVDLRIIERQEDYTVLSPCLPRAPTRDRCKTLKTPTAAFHRLRHPVTPHPLTKPTRVDHQPALRLFL